MLRRQQAASAAKALPLGAHDFAELPTKRTLPSSVVSHAYSASIEDVEKFF